VGNKRERENREEHLSSRRQLKIPLSLIEAGGLKKRGSGHSSGL